MLLLEKITKISLILSPNKLAIYPLISLLKISKAKLIMIFDNSLLAKNKNASKANNTNRKKERNKEK